MVYLVIVGSYLVNGVVVFYIELFKVGLFNEFYQFWLEKFNNKINGVMLCCWFVYCNFDLVKLFNKYIGEEWVGDFSKVS